MKEPVLVILKPDAIAKGLVGDVLVRFAEIDLDIIGMRVCVPTKKLAEEHYENIRGQKFFRGTVDFFMGKYNKQNTVIAIVYYGKHAITKCRKLIGATNPEEAHPMSLRGMYGRVTTKGIYENVVHASSSSKDARREIRLWFSPDMISKPIYSTRKAVLEKQVVRVWA